MATRELANLNPGRRIFSSRFATVTVWVITILWTIPTAGVFVTSFRDKTSIGNSGWWTVFLHPHFTLGNYKAIFTGGGDTTLNTGLLNYFFNSFAITIPAVIFPITLALMAGYILAWVRFRGSDTIYFIILALQIVPIQLAFIPLLQFFTGGAHIGHLVIFPALSHFLNGWHIGHYTIFPSLAPYAQVWIPHTMFGLPFLTFLLHNSVSSIPRELMEAARVDGANHFALFRRIVVPLSIPTIASAVIFQFLWVWNDLLVAITFSGGNPNSTPLNAELSGLAGAWGSHWEYTTAGAFITIIVPLIVFFSLQRYFVRGILAGSVK